MISKGDFFRSLGRKISLQIENDDQIDFDDLGDDDDGGEENSSASQRRESRGVSQVRMLIECIKLKFCLSVHHLCICTCKPPDFNFY